MTHNLKTAAAKAVLTSAVALAGLGLASGTAHAFDPQPDPPSNPRVTSVNPEKSFADGSVRVGDGSVRLGDGSVAIGSQARP
jgi:hypothetical protein